MARIRNVDEDAAKDSRGGCGLRCSEGQPRRIRIKVQRRTAAADAD
ncbi:MAG: hypothetical protein MRZ59_12325 [Clostridiales bacterium]|nr:hypothetical protein [Clostridiales bacterium]MDY3746014.1 hypothetical protein [Lachnospiraceae bacterium]